LLEKVIDMAEHHDAQKKNYETMEINIWPVVVSTAAIVVLSLLAFVAMWAMFHGLEQAKIYLTEAPPPMAANQKPYNGPLIQVVPPAELSLVRAATQKILTGYGWVDKDAGVVHIPVVRAMDLALERGFPVRK
jgi:hypothetical protein